jgi:hypothetical protein
MTETEFLAFLAEYGVPVTDAIRAEVARDQTDPSKWMIVPGSLCDLMEPADQSLYTEHIAEQIVSRAAVNKANPPRWMGPDGSWHDVEVTDEELPPPVVMQLKQGITQEQMADAVRPQLRAHRHYIEAFVKEHLI